MSTGAARRNKSPAEMGDAEREEMLVKMKAHLAKLGAECRRNAALSGAGNQERGLAPGLGLRQQLQQLQASSVRASADDGGERDAACEGGVRRAGRGLSAGVGAAGIEGGRVHARELGAAAAGGLTCGALAADGCLELLGTPLLWKARPSAGAPGSGGSATGPSPDSARGSTADGTPGCEPASTADSTPDCEPASTADSTPDCEPASTADSTPGCEPASTADSTPDCEPASTADSTPGSAPAWTPDSAPASAPGSAPDSGGPQGPAAPSADISVDTSTSSSAALRLTASTDEWLRFLSRERLRWEASGRSAKGLLRLCRLYAEALETPSSSRDSSYAQLHVQYAQLRAARDPGEGRAQFSLARLACRGSARVHVAAAQFALDHGAGTHKSASILRKATEAGAEPRSLVVEALQRLRAGCKQLLPPPAPTPARDKENAAPPQLLVTPAQVQGEPGDGETVTATSTRPIAGAGGGLGDTAAATAEMKKQQLKVNALLLNTADLKSIVATPTVLQPRENVFAVQTVRRDLPVSATPSGSHNAAAAGLVISSSAITADHGVPQTHLQRAADIDGSTPSRCCDGVAPLLPAPSASRVDKQSSCRDQETLADPVTSGGGAGQEPGAGSRNVPGDQRVRPSDCKPTQDSDRHPSAKEMQQPPAHEPLPQLTQQQQQPLRRMNIPEPQPVWTADPQPRKLFLDQANWRTTRKELDPHNPQLQQEELVWRHGREVIMVKGKPYLLLKVIGEGGAGKVYSALDMQTHVTRAVKYVPMLEETSEVADAYDEEIKHLQRLQHLSDKIIRLVEHEVTEQGTVMVMELGSMDLSTWLRETKKPMPQQRRWFWYQMVLIVEAIHKAGIVHGDLKPANFVFVDSNIKLIDFGIAKSLRAGVTSNVMQVAMGTINYMAPEMVGPQAKVGPKSDVWALGCILYLMTYRFLPFQKLKPREKLQAICDPKWAISFPEVDDDVLLVNMLKACLVRDPKKRLSIAEVLQHPYLNPPRSCTCGSSVVTN